MHAPVSVIIPCYCCADTISRAVNSVIGQTLRPEEIILVDDCSNDSGRTLLAINKLLQECQQTSIKVVALKKNCGPGSARNAGWELASQPYLAFLDADDIWHPQKIEIQYNWMASNPGMVLSGHRSLRIHPGDTMPELPMRRITLRIEKHRLIFKNYFPTRSVMIKRQIPYRFRPEMRYAEDYLLWLTIVCNGKSAWILNLPMSYSFKAEFGEGGLTGNLWKAQKGVLDTYQQLRELGLISEPLRFFVSCVSFIKYVRRWLLSRTNLT